MFYLKIRQITVIFILYDFFKSPSDIFFFCILLLKVLQIVISFWILSVVSVLLKNILLSVQRNGSNTPL